MRYALTAAAAVFLIAAGASFAMVKHGAAPGQQAADLVAASAEVTPREASRLIRVMRRVPGLRRTTHQKVPPKPGTSGDASGYTGNDSCQWANDNECDDPDIGTGACRQGTDYSDCWRIATGVEDNGCQWANDGECDEPFFGTGACVAGSDYADCGDVAHLRFQNDSCEHAYNGVCNEPGTGDGSCEPRTDRADCVGRERPMQISDHFFGRDDRTFMDTGTFPWTAVGTLVDPNGGSCTATLIGEAILVTAAHCVEYESGVDASATFTAGFGRREGPLSAEVIDYFLPPGRADEQGRSDEPSNTDWAFMRLNRPIGRELGQLQTRSLSHGSRRRRGAIGTTLQQAGFSWDTGDHLSGNMSCEVVGVEDENKFAHNCDTTTGDSGSPFIVRDGDEYYVVGVDSTYRIAPNTPAINIATGSDGWLEYVAGFASGDLGNGGLQPHQPANPKVPTR